MKYVIVGTGPTGLSLAYILAQNNKDVIIIEKNHQIGGSWNSEWNDKMYFTETSPRVLINDNGFHMSLLHELGFQDSDFHQIYGNFIQSSLKVIKFIMYYFHFFDYFKFIYALVKFKFVVTNMLMNKWINTSGISDSAKKAIRILCIIICDIPEKTHVNDFFGFLNFQNTIIQMKDPNKWHQIIEQRFNQMKNVQIIKNNKVNEILIDPLVNSNKVKGILCHDLLHNQLNTIYCDKLFLCTQSDSLCTITRNSNDLVSNNWFNQKYMEEWCSNTCYNDFGFQLHFRENIKFPEEWQWSTKTDWTIIILPVGEWLKTKSLNPDILTVWSCCIIDLNAISSNIKKSPNQCSANEIIQESMFQLNQIKKLPQPYKITFSHGLKKHEKLGWHSYNTGFTRNKYPYLPMKGNLDNLFALGCFTKPQKFSISHMGTAVEATIQYIRKYENACADHHPTSNFINTRLTQHNKQPMAVSTLLFLYITICLIVFFKFKK